MINIIKKKMYIIDIILLVYFRLPLRDHEAGNEVFFAIVLPILFDVIIKKIYIFLFIRDFSFILFFSFLGFNFPSRRVGSMNYSNWG